MGFRMYAIRCSEPDCPEVEILVEGERRMGDTVTCEQGHDAVVSPAVPRAIGILVEQVDHQLGTVWKSNAEYNDWVKYGNPVMRNGEVVGHREVVTMSDQERKSHRDQVIKDMEKVAAKNNLTLEQAHAVRAERTREKRAKEIEQGLTPTVSEPKPMDYGA